ncbi:MAG: dihydroorotate dehydrogenase-like protein [Dysgonamonadaceae bacterium]|jgi:dihydroorotate dehydrogenase (fumarate)|nr:dihydroorotate dehydrogenase-like protein [Dysgonamonadaceae bacterium]
MEAILETTFANLTLPNPIIIASSGLTDSVSKNRELEKAGAGALVLKSLFEEQISKNAASLLMGEEFQTANEHVLHYFKTNEVNNYLKLIRETKDNCRIPVIASVNCYKDDSWIEFACQIEMAGADALELNFFALHTELEKDAGFLDNACLRIARKVKDLLHIPVIVKMTKYFSHPLRLINELISLGISGVVLFNRFYYPDIDINRLQLTSGQVFSSYTDISDALRWTGIVSGKLPSASIAACTGIHDWESILKCILSGASAIQICSAVYQHGNEIIAQMKRSMEEWMHSMNFYSLNEFRGKLNYASIEDPSLYERVQFMRYFSNRD